MGASATPQANLLLAALARAPNFSFVACFTGKEPLDKSTLYHKPRWHKLL